MDRIFFCSSMKYCNRSFSEGELLVESKDDDYGECPFCGSHAVVGDALSFFAEAYC